MQKDPRRCQDLICRASAIQPDVISDPCTLYDAQRGVIESRRVLKRLLPTCSVFRQTALYGGRNRLQDAI
jgi:hypothetical protein